MKSPAAAGPMQNAVNFLTTPVVILTATFASLIGIATSALISPDSNGYYDSVDNLILQNPQNELNDYNDSNQLYDQSTVFDKFSAAIAVTGLAQQFENFTHNVIDTITTTINTANNSDDSNFTNNMTTETSSIARGPNNYWALFALVLVMGTAAGNILVCLAIAWERRLQNVTNYFLMSLAITDLMVAVLVMPLGILTLVKGEYYTQIHY